MDKKRDIVRFLIIITISFLIRLFYLIYISHRGGINITPDGKLYINLAQNLLRGLGLNNTLRTGLDANIIVPPVYPLLISGVIAIFKSYYPVVYLQALLSSISCGLVYLIGKHIWNTRVGLWAAFFMTFYPQNIFRIRDILTETVFTFLLVLFTYILVLILYKNFSRKRMLILLGVVWGVMNLVRPHLLLFIPVVYLLLGLNYGWSKALKQTFVVILCAFIVMSPWLIRNGLKGAGWLTIANYTGINLYLGNNPRTNPENPYVSSDPKVMKYVESLPLSQSDAAFKNIAFDFIKKHPVKTFVNLIKKEMFFYKSANINAPFPFSGRFHIGVLPYLIDTSILILGLLGAILDLKEWRRNSLLYLLGLYFSLLTSAFIVVEEARYRMPMMFVLFLFAAYFLVTCQKVIINRAKPISRS